MDTVVAETTAGRLRGSVVDGVSVFRGVRYGESTAGGNRFMPPRPPVPWAGVRDAFEWGASAPQLPVPHNTDPFYAWYSAIRPASEDCLFLNVFAPAIDTGRRPVMVWVHGGGWRDFAGTAPGFDGTALARAEEVVVVTVNHRLSVFGFLPLDDPDPRFADAGNAGLLDLVAALAWVRDNIAAFGGDPTNVTLFGESGGASKAAAILALPAAQRLFHKVIVQSSAGGMRLATPADRATLASGLARAFGVERLDAATLQSIPMDLLLAAAKAVPGAFRAGIDGRHFHHHPYVDTAPLTARGVPMLAGCTATEATYYLRGDPANFTLDRAAVRRRLARFLEIDEPHVDRILAGYADTYPGVSAARLLVHVATDFMFRRNTGAIASIQAAAGAAPVFTYLFDWATPIEGGHLGSPHTCEVPFVFGTTEAAAAMVGQGEDLRPMTARMMSTWAAFARTGDPNNPTVPDWRPTTADAPRTMVLGLESQFSAEPGGAALAALSDLPHFGYDHVIDRILRD